MAKDHPPPPAPKGALLAVAAAFLVSGAVVVLYARHVGAQLRAMGLLDEHVSLIPSSLHELTASAHSIHAAAQAMPGSMALLFCVAYLFKQTFSFPGSAALNALGGIAFGLPTGLLLAQTMTVAGTALAFLGSRATAWPLIKRFRWDTRLAPLQQKVESARAAGTLFWYLCALRMTTLFPQWLVNLGAPHIGIPLRLFVPCTLIGLVPYNYVTVRAGSLINEVDPSAVFSLKTGALLMVIAAVFVLPAVLMRRCESRLLRGGSGGGGGGAAGASGAAAAAGGASAEGVDARGTRGPSPSGRKSAP